MILSLFNAILISSYATENIRPMRGVRKCLEGTCDHNKCIHDTCVKENCQQCSHQIMNMTEHGPYAKTQECDGPNCNDDFDGKDPSTYGPANDPMPGRGRLGEDSSTYSPTPFVDNEPKPGEDTASYSPASIQNEVTRDE